MDIKRVEMKAPSYEAVLITEDNIAEVAEWCGGTVVNHRLKTSNGGIVYSGEWLVRNSEVKSFEAVGNTTFKKVFREVVTVRCQFCQTDKPFSEMSKRTDGQFSTMCQFCEDEELARIQERRESLTQK